MNHKESFLQYLETEKRYSPNTVRSYLNDLDQFYSFQSARLNPTEPVQVSSHDIRSWIVNMLENGYSPVSIHQDIMPEGFLQVFKERGNSEERSS